MIMNNNIINKIETFTFKGVTYEGNMNEVIQAHEDAVCEQNCQIELEQYIEEYCTPVNINIKQWESIYDDNGFYYIIDTRSIFNSPYIVATGGEGDVDKANAAFICKAVNNYDSLLEALTQIINLAIISNVSVGSVQSANILKIAKAAIQKAEQ